MRESSERATARALLAGPLAGASRGADLGLLVLRIVAGVAMALNHGLGKLPPSDAFIAHVQELGFPAPVPFAWLSALAEFGGGLLLTLGLFTRIAALLVAGGMGVAALLAHAGDPFSTREAAVLFLGIAVLYLLAGPGRYSLDAVLFRRARDTTRS